jgi:hypothetical protein
MLFFLNFRLRFYYRLEQKTGNLGQGKWVEVWKQAVSRSSSRPSGSVTGIPNGNLGSKLLGERSAVYGELSAIACDKRIFRQLIHCI